MPDEDRTVLCAVSAVFVLWLFYLALRPFAWSFDPADMLERLGEGLTLSSDYWLIHAMVGAIMGSLLALIGRGTTSSQLCALVTLFVALESAQILVSYRHPRPVDLSIQLLTGGLLILLVNRLRARGFALRLSPTGASRFARALAIGGALALSWFFVDAMRLTRLTSWNPPYSLLVGNERTGNRPWRGCIRGFALYDRALAA